MSDKTTADDLFSALVTAILEDYKSAVIMDVKKDDKDVTIICLKYPSDDPEHYRIFPIAEIIKNEDLKLYTPPEGVYKDKPKASEYKEQVKTDKKVLN